MSQTWDAIVVGSGASAVHAAWPLVMAGLRVLMIDVGNDDEVYRPLFPAGAFDAIRRTDSEDQFPLLEKRPISGEDGVARVVNARCLGSRAV